MMVLPPHLYKYEAFSAQALENLKAQRIYFGSPSGFNDPYDCATNPIVLKPTAEEAELVRQQYLNKESSSEQARHEFTHVPLDQLQDTLQRAGQRAIQSSVSNFLRRRGVSCFSERKDDLLMWGHYAGKYKGFCCEFSTELMPFSDAKPVRYTQEIPKTSVIPYLTGQGLSAVEDIFSVKSASWSYEQEWRVFHEKAGTLYHYEAAALTGVYFGPETSQEAIEIIALVLRGQNPSVRLFKGERSENEYKVVFSEFKYLTLLEAKELGLR